MCVAEGRLKLDETGITLIDEIIIAKALTLSGSAVPLSSDLNNFIAAIHWNLRTKNHHLAAKLQNI